MNEPATCPHPPSRLYAGWARDERLELVLWVGCCDCGQVLQGGAETGTRFGTGVPDPPESTAPNGA